jgi:tetratricopeptide (TPR) repeat protein
MPSPVLSLAIGRYKQLALRSNEVWQGGVFRLPTWVENGPGGEPYRPWGGVWTSERTGMVHVEAEPEFGAHGHDLALRALVEFGLRYRKHDIGRPARLRVTDPDLAAHLTSQLQDSETSVEVVRDLPVVRDALRHLAEDLAGGELPPDLLDARGVTVDRLRAFADAAASFYAAAPWDHLQNEDLIEIRAPGLPRAMSRLIVMGNAGVNFGLAFFDSRAAFERLAFGAEDGVGALPSDAWALFFGGFDELSLGDADAWEQYSLPVAETKAYPYVQRVLRDGTVQRPVARELAGVEAVLRALAATTEEQLDAGEWTVDVATHDGAVTMKLTLPLLLEAERGSPRTSREPDRRAFERLHARVGRFFASHEFESIEAANEALAAARQSGLFDADHEAAVAAMSPLERAQELVYDAADAVGRLRVKRARRALEISPDCADAWTMLAEAASSGVRARDLYVRAVEAGERALGAEAFESLRGHFWGHLETRPYMRARFGLAQELIAAGEREAAMSHCESLLDLNPNDNQGVRYALLTLLLEEGRADEVERLLQRYEDDVAAEWCYGRALHMFRRHGDGPQARQALDAAVRINPHVVHLLLQREDVPFELPGHYALGSPEEAAACATELADAWDATPGALSWLGRRVPPAIARGGTRSRPRRGRTPRRRR